MTGKTMIPLPDDSELTRRPGYDYGAKRITLKVAKVIVPETRETRFEKIFAALLKRLGINGT